MLSLFKYKFQDQLKPTSITLRLTNLRIIFCISSMQSNFLQVQFHTKINSGNNISKNKYMKQEIQSNTQQAFLTVVEADQRRSQQES